MDEYLMPFDLVGWSEAAPGTGTVGVAGGLLDQFYRVVLDDIWVRADTPYLAGLVYSAESTPGYAELRQPGLDPPLMFIQSADLNDACPINGFSNLLERPARIKPSTKLTAYSNNATDEDTIIGALLASGVMTPYKGPIDHIIRGYADQTLTANSWTMCNITWNQDIPEGNYSIVGCKIGSYISSGWMAALGRLLLKGKYANWRPGVPVTQAAGDKLVLDATDDLPYTQWPLMPEVGLNHAHMPDIEILSPAALTDHIVELQLVAQ